MSRTYRNTGFSHWRDPLEELVDGWEPGNDICYIWGWTVKSWKKIDPKSEQGRRILARNRRDKTIRCKEPGPKWFRNLLEERPLRRSSKRELQKFMANEDYEPMIDPKQRKKIYWT